MIMSIKYTEIAALEHLKKDLNFMVSMGILSGKQFKECGEVDKIMYLI